MKNPPLNTTTTGLNLDAARWETPPLHIPDDLGGAYKTELVLQRVPHVEKINWWHAPDPRGMPHNHPWPFRSTVLRGGYTETRWTPTHDDFTGPWTQEKLTHKAGDIVTVPAFAFHTVDAVEPGTVTHMACGAMERGGKWGHILVEADESDGRFTFFEARPDQSFLEKLRALNPHMRKRG